MKLCKLALPFLWGHWSAWLCFVISVHSFSLQCYDNVTNNNKYNNNKGSSSLQYSWSLSAILNNYVNNYNNNNNASKKFVLLQKTWIIVISSDFSQFFAFLHSFLFSELISHRTVFESDHLLLQPSPGILHDLRFTHSYLLNI